MKKGQKIVLFYVWCRHQESNSGPADYKSAALPRLSYSGVIAMVDQNEARMLQKKTIDSTIAKL